mmetsp:Transcript_9739/g.25020  ORF Transcript_9739/g.25020 Transcript_9739/m.25020 type:complete len:992 (-) Transcript_9739:1639-4614(-)
MSKAKSFLGMPAPPGYVAGIGRGASGFTTRSDIGPSADSDMAVPSQQQVQAAVRKMQAEDGGVVGENLNDTNYDEFSGYGGSLFSKGNFDKDDDEADLVYEMIEERQDQRRKAHRERFEKEQLLKLRKERPKIQQQFADLKRQLTEVSAEEWANLPDAADIGKKVKKKRVEKFTAAPDSFLDSARAMSSLHTAASFASGTQTAFAGTDTSFAAMGSGTGTVIPGMATATPGTQTAYAGIGTALPGMSTAMPGHSGHLNLGEIGHARKTMMGVKLDQAGGAVSGRTAVDTAGYLTDLNSIAARNSMNNIGDLQKGRLLLKRVRQTNPKKADAWIASASLEEADHKIQAARNIIMKGTEACPKSEEVWLEAIRLMPPTQAKAVAAQAITSIGKTSVKLWLRAKDLETEKKAQRAVLRKALETIPDAVMLWKAAVELEEPKDARILLQRAVECCPDSVELWLALAHLESYKNAQAVLNKARLACPTERTIWITAAKLEESMGNLLEEEAAELSREGKWPAAAEAKAKEAPIKIANVEKIIQTSVKSLRTNGVEINRDEWVKEAIKAEQIGRVATAQAIMRAVIGEGVDPEDRKSQWIEDAENAVKTDSYGCARAVYAHMLAAFPEDESLWLKAAFFEKEHGDSDLLDEHLARAVKFCPQAEVLWLMGAKQKWINGDIKEAQNILAAAFSSNPNSEEIWLAAVKLESQTNHFERARLLLQNARKKAGTSRVWWKSARLEWEQGDLRAAKALLDQAVKIHEDEPRLWMMRGQIEEQQGNIGAARDVFAQGRKFNPKSATLWILAAKLEVRAGAFTRARSLLEKGRTAIPGCPELWLEGCRVETAAGFGQNAKTLMARALQECPDSGLLWSNSIFMESKPARRTRSVDAMKRCEHNPLVLLAVANLFHSERKIQKARSWYHKTVKLDPDFGDAWAEYYRFERQFGDEEKQEAVAKHCETAEPRHGEAWQQVAKHVENWKKTTQEILELTAKSLPEIV